MVSNTFDVIHYIMTCSVLLIDDHSLFLDGLQLMLGTNERIKIAGTCANGLEALEFLKQNSNVDLVLMDINMPVMNGYETSIKIAELYPEIKIIALSMFIEHNNIHKMLHAGVQGYLYKNADLDYLIGAIDTVMQHDYFVEPDAQHILKSFLKEKKDEKKGYYKFQKFDLSNREKEILQYIMSGMTNQEIAKKIFLSPRTIDTHRKNILSKLGLRNTASLVKYATENKIFLGID